MILVLFCFLCPPLGCAPVTGGMDLGQEPLKDTHCSYFAKQPTGKNKFLVMLMDLRLFCSNIGILHDPFGRRVDFFFFFCNQIYLMLQGTDWGEEIRDPLEERSVIDHLITNHLVVRANAKAVI